MLFLGVFLMGEGFFWRKIKKFIAPTSCTVPLAIVGNLSTNKF